jgi:two-component system, chemotaxis family, chemotaxis protein CheY
LKTKQLKIKLPGDKIMLILEDIKNIREKLVQDIRDLGFCGDIKEAEDVKGAVAICNQSNIDFIISDWNLPDSTGLEFLKKLKQTNKFKNTPFLMCTTLDEVENIIEAINEGASDYIVKPWEPNDLCKKVNMVWDAFLG